MSRAAARSRHEHTCVRRDMDLHPDYAAEPVVQRAKRQLSASVEEHSAKLRRLRSTAEAKAYEVYDQAPSARELRATTREALREKTAAVVNEFSDELAMLADEVHAASTAVKAAGSTVAAASVGLANGLHAHGVAQKQLVEAKVEAVKEQAVTAVKAGVWSAMSYLQPRVSWSMGCALGFRAPAPAPVPAPVPKRAAEPAVGTLVVEESAGEQGFAA